MKDRILLLGHMRSGSTQYYDAFNAHHCATDVNYMQCIGEVYTVSPKTISAFKKFISRYKLDIQKLATRDKNELTKAFIYAFKEDKFMLKYFPYVMKKNDVVLTSQEIMRLCKKHKAEVHFLYRKNILDTLISYIVSMTTDIFHNNLKNSLNIKFENIIVDNNLLEKHINDVCEQIKITHDEYKLFNDANMIDKVMIYEDNIVTGNYMYASESSKHRRMNSDTSKNIILNNNPDILSLLKQYCEKYELNIDKNYNLCNFIIKE